MSKPEGIEFNPIGTVDVTFDGTTYHLGRPKMRQFRHFTETLENVRREVTDRLAELQRKAEDDPDNQAVRDEISEFARDPFYNRTIPVVAEMFAQLGDALPDDPDDWPAWLGADSTLPGEILKHWRNSPKASGPTPPI